jgi:uncharacterized protein (TIGR03437 family)
LIRLKFVLFAALLGVFLIPHSASAVGAPANISIVQGSGQLICDGCPLTAFPSFDPLIVLVTDANGVPVPGATVTWEVTTGGGSFAGLPQTMTTTGSAPVSGSNAGVLCNAYNTSEAELAGATCVIYTEGSPATPSLGFLSDSVTASISTGQSVTFYLTQSPNAVAGQANTNYITSSIAISPIQPETLISGPANSVYTGGSIQVLVQTLGGTNIPNVSVRLFPESSTQGGASISCQSQSNPSADSGYPGYPPGYPGTTQAVMTNSSGVATCTPVFGPTASSTPENFHILVGGVPFLQNPSSQVNGSVLGSPAGNNDFREFPATATPVTPAKLTITGGNGQTVQIVSGAPTVVPTPLGVQVTDANGNPLAGETVTWSATPAGSVSSFQATTTTNNQGQTSNTVTLAASASGAVTVTATLNTLSASFTITATQPAPAITGLSIVSGNNQSAQTGAPFSAPLVVQTTPAIGGVTVQFAITGGSGTLSASSAQTLSNNGQASIGVTAGSTAGTLTIQASVSGVTPVTFTLTVTPPPPPISATSFLNGAGFFSTQGTQQTALSPCGVGTMVVGSSLATGAIPATPNMYAAPLQQTQGISITFPNVNSGMSTAPLLNISTAITNQQLVTFQVPCDAAPSNATVGVTINGTSINVPNVTVRPGAPGIFEMVGSDGVRRAIAVRPDGSIVSPSNPARRSETILIYITGVGPVVPPLNSGSLPIPGVTSSPSNPSQVIVGLNGNGEGGVTVQASPDLIGVYVVSFIVPNDSTVQGGGVDNVLAVGVIAEGNPEQFGQPSKLPIQ